MSPAAMPPIDDVLFLQEAVGAAAALRAAQDLGVLARLHASPADAATIARDCAISPRGAHALLAALAVLGLARPTRGGAFRTVADPGRLRAHLGAWDELTEVIRTDQPVVRGDTLDGAQTLYPEVVPHLASWFAEAAEHSANLLAQPGLRVLDVGAGAAPWSRAIAARDATCQVTAVDVPVVLQATHRAVEATGLAPQFRYLGGDAFTLELEIEAYDLVIVANFCHLFDESHNRRLLGRLIGAVCPGGTLAILDEVPNERFDGPRPVVLYALGLLLRTSRGQVYPFSTYVAWLHQAGYEAVERSDLPAAPPISLITARRPS